MNSCIYVCTRTVVYKSTNMHGNLANGLAALLTGPVTVISSIVKQKQYFIAKGGYSDRLEHMR